MICNRKKQILFLGLSVAGGAYHDLRLLQRDFEGREQLFKDLELWLDLGYVGVEKTFTEAKIKRPHKKPRKSRKNPDPQLSDEQKAENKDISKVRIVVEHAIGFMKRYAILTTKLRARSKRLIDSAILVCAGLCNFKLNFS